jgi:hypothetical protein
MAHFVVRDAPGMRISVVHVFNDAPPSSRSADTATSRMG